MSSPSSTGSLERALSGFANTAAAIGALFLVPFVAQHGRVPVYHYISISMAHEWAYWGSWLFVILVALGSFFGVSAILQVLVKLLFHRGSGYKGGF